jgi:hypothetical protein
MKQRPSRPVPLDDGLIGPMLEVAAFDNEGGVRLSFGEPASVCDRMRHTHGEATIERQHPRYLANDSQQVINIHQDVVGNDQLESSVLEG